jgi:hypothetical protein
MRYIRHWTTYVLRFRRVLFTIKLLHKNVSFFVFITYALLDEFMCFT